MDRANYTDQDYRQPHVPPGTPPVVDPNADPRDAARLTMVNGDSDSPGSRPGSFPRGKEDEELQPGGAPDEVTPDGGDVIEPGAPDEIEGEPGDTTEPGATPDEAEPAPPPETPPPPD